MDWFMRDGEVRETINMAISRERTLRTFLMLWA